jgi:dephospho-CoA kinase
VGFGVPLWYAYHMRVIVMTGGLGSGKSTAAEHFRTKGASVVDLDEVGIKLLAPGSPLLQRVAEAFADDEVLLADGRLDRAALARAAFASPDATRRLNNLVHPAIARDAGVAIEQLRLLPEPPFAVVLEVPLLVEAPVLGQLGDVVLALVAPETVRLDRAVARGMDRADALRRLRAQATDAERVELSDVAIINDGSLERFLGELDSFWEEYAAVGGGRADA